jgi:hypothetical protein
MLTYFLSRKKGIQEKYKKEVYKLSSFIESRVIDNYHKRNMLGCLSIKRRRRFFYR